jgi:succinate dehydrogenase hydrophobic anchor subunit
VQYILAQQTSFLGWLLLSTAYSILYMPTLALTNSIAFANLRDPTKSFPPVRMLGTVGWIIASVAFPLIAMKTQVGFVGYWPFLDGVARPDAQAQVKHAVEASGVLSVLYGFFALLFLPKTPPRKQGNPLAFAEALELFAKPTLLVIATCALLISMIHQCYFFRAGDYITSLPGLSVGDVGPSMAIGQVSEIVVLAFVLGLAIQKLGFKWILVLGALSYALRYAVFGLFPSPGAMKLAMLLHGFNYGFFFAGSFLLIEKLSPAHIRHTAQTVFGIFILGLGPILAGYYNQLLTGMLTTKGDQKDVFNFSAFWLIQASIAAVAFVALLLLVRRADLERPSGPVDSAGGK